MQNKSFITRIKHIEVFILSNDNLPKIDVCIKIKSGSPLKFLCSILNVINYLVKYFKNNLGYNKPCVKGCHKFVISKTLDLLEEHIDNIEPPAPEPPSEPPA